MVISKVRSKDAIRPCARPADIVIGCCGFGMSQKEYVQIFRTVEIQQTFYQPPQIATLEKWRREAPADFEFAIKAWQLITHTAKSPTYRRLKKPLSAEDAAGCGSFKASAIVDQAWQTTLACARALQAKKILFQCPASFIPTDDNIDAFRSFFQKNKPPADIQYFWEPRGDCWSPALIEKLCRELRLFHAVDPFVHDSVTPQNLYYRLHGKGGWRYTYSEAELDELWHKVPAGNGALILFNNGSMVANAQQMQALLESR
jgi:uncharacterized protein YecE (DUF72 family)